MFRPTLLAAAFVAAAIMPLSALAAPIGPVSAIHVTAGPEVAADTKVVDQRDIDYLTTELHRSLERNFKRTHDLSDQGGVLDIQLVKAEPSRPTLTQMSRNTGLSMRSVSRGGMAVTGTYTAADGTVTPVKFQWESFDIRDSIHGSTWSDAEEGFDRFAVSLTSKKG